MTPSSRPARGDIGGKYGSRRSNRSAGPQDYAADTINPETGGPLFPCGHEAHDQHDCVFLYHHAYAPPTEEGGAESVNDGWYVIYSDGTPHPYCHTSDYGGIPRVGKFRLEPDPEKGDFALWHWPSNNLVYLAHRIRIPRKP